MAVVEIKNLERAQKLLSGVKNGIERATSSAVNRSITTIKKDLKKEVIKNYVITSSEVEKTLSVKKANFKKPFGFINSKSERLSLYKFFSSKKSDGTIFVKVKKKNGRKKVQGKENLLGKPFIARLKTGHTGIFQRSEKTSLKKIISKSGKEKEKEVPIIKDLKTVSIPQMLGTDSVQDYVNEKAPEILEKNLDKEIDRILKGYYEKNI